ncbi:MAG: Holliday junction resolvase RuvX [Spirochaetota bacterium]
MGIDFGEVRIGLSISDSEKKVAFPLDVIKREGGSYCLNKLKKIIEDQKLNIDAFVVGVPYKSNGTAGEQGKKVHDYINSLKNYFSVEVIEWDERFTTSIAERALISGDVSRNKRRNLIDKVSSQIILQSYLDYINSPHP